MNATLFMCLVCRRRRIPEMLFEFRTWSVLVVGFAQQLTLNILCLCLLHQDTLLTQSMLPFDCPCWWEDLLWVEVFLLRFQRLLQEILEARPCKKTFRAFFFFDFFCSSFCNINVPLSGDARGGPWWNALIDGWISPFRPSFFFWVLKISRSSTFLHFSSRSCKCACSIEKLCRRRNSDSCQSWRRAFRRVFKGARVVWERISSRYTRRKKKTLKCLQSSWLETSVCGDWRLETSISWRISWWIRQDFRSWFSVCRFSFSSELQANRQDFFIDIARSW